jgi:hypothetical protein
VTRSVSGTDAAWSAPCVGDTMPSLSWQELVRDLRLTCASGCARDFLIENTALARSGVVSACSAPDSGASRSPTYQPEPRILPVQGMDEYGVCGRTGVPVPGIRYSQRNGMTGGIKVRPINAYRYIIESWFP